MSTNDSRTYPRYRAAKNVQIKMTPQMGIIECSHKHLIRAFGQPTFTRDAGDEFDGVERIAWHIQFESGETVRICDVRSFGSIEDEPSKVTNWRVNTHSTNAYEWIKEAIRDSNPNG